MWSGAAPHNAGGQILLLPSFSSHPVEQSPTCYFCCCCWPPHFILRWSSLDTEAKHLSWHPCAPVLYTAPLLSCTLTVLLLLAQPAHMAPCRMQDAQ